MVGMLAYGALPVVLSKQFRPVPIGAAALAK
jgi:hypothetical protein